MKSSVDFEGSQISYSVTGEGNPLILLHGYLEAGEIWDPVVEQLRAEFRLIVPDLPGHGYSGVKGELHTMEFLAGAVRAVISDAGEERVLMVGHSLGGYVTLAFAELYPDMLSGYVLFHSHPHADTPEAIARRRREIVVVRAGKKNIMYPGNINMMYAPMNLESMQAEIERSKSIASRSSGEGIIAMLNGMIARPSRRGVVEGGRLPLLWILGRHDLYFSPGKALGDLHLPDNARVVILENSGHLGFIEEQELSVELLGDFARAIRW